MVQLQKTIAHYKANSTLVYIIFSAQEMITQDKVVELLQQRQEKDLKQLNKVGRYSCHAHYL